MKKIDLEAKIYKLKTNLYDGSYEEMDEEWHDGAHYMLGKILEYMQEFRE